ncbi:MAG TPA: phage baseplate assembly protein V [Rhodocyclaceae bacterium]|nr:phage baseplate assembly protein V [Rhodocyclaceae bacterium]
MDLVELSRRLENLIRIGTVLEVDHTGARCRFKSGRLETNWRPWIAYRAGETRTWDPPTRGEQAILFSPSGEPENGIVLVGINSDAYPAPSSSPDEHATDYPDGARIAYNHASGALTVTGIKTALIQATEHCTVDCPENTITGNVLIQGTLTVEKLLTYQAGMQGSGGAGASAIIDGTIQVTGDVTAGPISLRGHHHDEHDGGSTEAAK